MKFVRYLVNCVHIGGDIFTFFTIAARGCNRQHAFLKTQRAGEPVNFRLGCESQFAR